jgi:hypothetical protein
LPQKVAPESARQPVANRFSTRQPSRSPRNTCRLKYSSRLDNSSEHALYAQPRKAASAPPRGSRQPTFRPFRPCLACWNGARSPSEAGIRGIPDDRVRAQVGPIGPEPAAPRQDKLCGHRGGFLKHLQAQGAMARILDVSASGRRWSGAIGARILQ